MLTTSLWIRSLSLSSLVIKSVCPSSARTGRGERREKSRNFDVIECKCETDTSSHQSIRITVLLLSTCLQCSSVKCEFDIVTVAALCHFSECSIEQIIRLSPQQVELSITIVKELDKEAFKPQVLMVHTVYPPLSHPSNFRHL